MTGEPFRMSAAEARRAMADGTLTARALAESCLDRIDRREDRIGAWVEIGRDQALVQADAVDHGEVVGPLAGITVGIKDVIDAMPFHEQVIKETMRLYPPVSLIDRVAVADIDFGDVQVKKGDFAFALIYVMHRHKRLWERPERFDPDRFSEARAKGIPRFQYMPFGAGPRICIGMKFAYMEAIAILATLVRRLRFLPNADHKVEPNIRITLRPEGGMPLFVERR